jgi:hypothetical protein
MWTRTIVSSCAVMALVACSSSGSSGGDGGGEDTGATGSSSSGAGSSGASSGGMDASILCMSAVDCTEGGATQLCCYDTTTMIAACQAGPCPMYTQCASSDSECPMGLHCIQSPLGANIHYCGMGAPGDGGGSPGDAASESTPAMDSGSE